MLVSIGNMAVVQGYLVALCVVALLTVQAQELTDNLFESNINSRISKIDQNNPENGPHEFNHPLRKRDLLNNEKELEGTDLQSMQSKILSTMPSSDLDKGNRETNNWTPKVYTTTQPPEPLPTPLPQHQQIVTEGGEPLEKLIASVSTDVKSSSSVRKDGVQIKKPSVGRKDADPKLFKPSVIGRKGVNNSEIMSTEAPVLTPANTTNENSNNTTAETNTLTNTMDRIPVTTTSIPENTKLKTNVSMQDLNKAPDSLKDSKTTPVHVLPVPIRLNDTSTSQNLTKTTSTSDSSSIPVSEMTTTTLNPKTTSPADVTTAEPTSHPKPTAAVDTDTAADYAESENASYTPAVIGIVLLVAIVLTIIGLAYRRFSDVWMRRHYDRMDFLIDGMYDM